ncbi:MAG: hypothetical protein ABR524_13705 [Thermoanaerobaculia bacterium]
MDIAVGLVRAYLQLNGYFTVSEYPVVRKVGEGRYRTLTDVDVAGYHLPHGQSDFEPDPVLRIPADRPDILIGEVKEGLAQINESVNDPEVVAKILKRFAGCSASEGASAARTLLASGEVDIRSGHRVRLVAFGTVKDAPGAYLKILHSEVVAYLDRYIAENWEVVRQSGSKDPVFGFMVLLAKARGAVLPSS